MYLDEVVTTGQEGNEQGSDGSSSITDCPLKEQLKALHSQIAALRHSLVGLQTKIEAHSTKTERYFRTISSNVKRISIAPQNSIPQASALVNGQVDSPLATLSKQPKCLYSLWDEYVFGIGGRKPAKDFTPSERGSCKFKYSRRKVVWGLILQLVDSGLSAQVAIDRIYAAYGQQKTVTQLIESIRRDKKNDVLPLYSVLATRRL